MFPTLFLACALASAPAIGANARVAGNRPNFLLIVTDDQRNDTLDFMPRIKQRLVDHGITFSNAFVSTSLCCPSRSSILTGLYATHHQVQGNRQTLVHPTIFGTLHDSGYFTGLVGKGVCGWFDRPQPGFDYWVSGEGYKNPRLNVAGKFRTIPGYGTHIIRDYGLDFVRQAAGRKQPFALFFTPYAPHRPATPAPGDELLYPNLLPFSAPSMNEADISDKPGWFQKIPIRTPDELLDGQTFRRAQLQCLKSVDEAFEALYQELVSTGQINNTVIIFTSDNGLLLGEHRLLRTKFFGFEEANHVPLVIRYPAKIVAPKVENRMVGNIDLAPTICELAGVATTWKQDGESLIPLIEGTFAWRDEMLVEGWPQNPYRGIRTSRFKYLEYAWDTPELYDLANDPFELDNLAKNPLYANARADLQRRLAFYSEGTPVEDTSTMVQFGSWRRVSDPRASNGTIMLTRQAGATVSYTPFRGTIRMLLYTYLGPNQGRAAVTIDGVRVATLDLYAPKPTYRVLRAFNGLLPGFHKIQIQALGTKNSRSTGIEVRIDGFDAPLPVEENNPLVSYDGWMGVAADVASGGSSRTLTSEGFVKFEFDGDSLVFLTAKGPQFSKANVRVDGVHVAQVDLFSLKASFRVPVAISGLGAGHHVATIGTTNPRGGIVFDAFYPFGGAAKLPIEGEASCCSDDGD